MGLPASTFFPTSPFSSQDGSNNGAVEGRILLIDSYDSFSLNLGSLIRKQTNCEVITIHNDSLPAELLISRYLPLFDAVVIGPGPGHPENPEDVGVLPHLLNIAVGSDSLLPIFGVCLGFQSLVLSVGGKVIRLPEPRHGQVGYIRHSGTELFDGISQDNHFESVRYHSLHGVISSETESEERVIPLAWVGEPSSADEVLMAGKHSTKPFWGVQYHPESICSQHGDTAIRNFWKMAKEWNKSNNRQRSLVTSNADSEQLQDAYQEILSLYSIKPVAFPRNFPFNLNSSADNKLPHFLAKELQDIIYQSINISSVKCTSNYFTVLLCEQLKKQGVDFTLLNSASFPGRWSVIGLLEPNETVCIKYYNDYNPDYVFLQPWNGPPRTNGEDTESSENEVKIKLNNDKKDGGIWGFLSSYMEPKIEKYKHAINFDSDNLDKGLAPPDAAFCGGLIGYISYEGSQDAHEYPSRTETNSVDRLSGKRPSPDINLVDIERMVLVDGETQKAYVVSLKDKEENSPWFASVMKIVNETLCYATDDSEKFKLEIPRTCREYFATQTPEPVSVTIPDKAHYIKRILECQEELRAGNSYELCMTGQTTITMPSGVTMDPWNLYKVLYIRNPAPYSCLFDFAGAVLVGASPERFMSWSGRTGRCEFRPIKGTVKKGGVNGDGKGEGSVSYEEASKILNTPKERGENLMIVDLIRHDLNMLLENVEVEKLMGVEEYKTVYQLVSVISGKLKQDNPEKEVHNYRGFDVLVHSLPPGSMTGAPKLRSVELLRGFEDYKPRGIYSGVSGYWSVLDEGDWSVVIRSAFRYKSEFDLSQNEDQREVWRIGAGGAITILSNPEEEWEEMEIKLESALQAFQ